MSTHAEAAKMVRKELKQTFPEIKFRVTSKSYSGGDSLRVSWINGPTSKEINAIISKYQYGHFDGMYDIYENSNNRNDIPQVKYVFADREIAEEIKEEVFKNLQRTHAHFDQVKSIDETSQILLKHWSFWTAREYISHMLCKLDLSKGFNKEMIYA